MEHLHKELQEIKQLSEQIETIESEKEYLNQQLNQYKSSVSNFIHRFRRAESLMEIEHDPDLASLTETTNQKVRTMEDKIQGLVDQISKLETQYEQIFEQRRVIVQQVVDELNKTIIYAYPFGMEKPTIRMGKYYHITDDGDVMCEMRFESNSYFNDEFYPIV